MKHYDFDLDSKKVYVATLPSTQFSKNPKTLPAASWSSIFLWLPISHFLWPSISLDLCSVLWLVRGRAALWAEGMISPNLVQLVPCGLCLVHLVPCTLYLGPCMVVVGRGDHLTKSGLNSTQICPDLKSLWTPIGQATTKTKTESVIWPNISLRIEVKSALLLGRGIFIFPVSSFVLKHIVEHFHISSVDWSVSFHR